MQNGRYINMYTIIDVINIILATAVTVLAIALLCTWECEHDHSRNDM